MKKILRICFVAAVFMILSCSLVSAATWRIGCVPDRGDNTSGIVVRLTNKKKNAKVKIHTYAPTKRSFYTKEDERGCDLYVTMRDQKGRWIWGGDIKTGRWGKTLNLGNDHSVYVIYLKHKKSIHCWDFFHYCPKYYGVECTSNCSVK